jgi:hypothetical protein
MVNLPQVQARPLSMNSVLNSWGKPAAALAGITLNVRRRSSSGMRRAHPQRLVATIAVEIGVT